MCVYVMWSMLYATDIGHKKTDIDKKKIIVLGRSPGGAVGVYVTEK